MVVGSDDDYDVICVDDGGAMLKALTVKLKGVFAFEKPYQTNTKILNMPARFR